MIPHGGNKNHYLTEQDTSENVLQDQVKEKFKEKLYS